MNGTGVENTPYAVPAARRVDLVGNVTINTAWRTSLQSTRTSITTLTGPYTSSGVCVAVV